MTTPSGGGSWFVVLPPSQNKQPVVGYEIVQASSAAAAIAAVRVKFPALASKTTYPANQWQTWGPYTSQTIAQQKQQAIQGQAQGSLPGVLPLLPSSFPNPLNLLAGLSWLEEVGHWMGVFVTAVTDPFTWISLGWGFLGIVLLVVGILWWFRSTQAGKDFTRAATDVGLAAAA